MNRMPLPRKKEKK